LIINVSTSLAIFPHEIIDVGIQVSEMQKKKWLLFNPNVKCFSETEDSNQKIQFRQTQNHDLFKIKIKYLLHSVTKY